MWWVFAELGRRLGYDLGTLGDPDSSTDDDVLAVLLAGARTKYDEVAATGWAEVAQELPAPWVDDHIARMGGWRLAPPLFVDQLAALEPPAPLVMVPRRQRRKLNGQLDFLGEPPEIFINPDDGAAAGVVHGRRVTVRSANGELTGLAKIDAFDTARGGVDSARPPRGQRQSPDQQGRHRRGDRHGPLFRHTRQPAPGLMSGAIQRRRKARSSAPVRGGSEGAISMDCTMRMRISSRSSSSAPE